MRCLTCILNEYEFTKLNKRRGILITEMRPGMGKVRTFSALLSLTLRRKEEERNSER